MRIPSFRQIGGKARLRKWLVNIFPKKGRKYVEPFAGRANVFFYSRKSLDFNEWILNDINIKFLQSLLLLDIDLLPEHVEKKDFEYYKNLNNVVSRTIEPRITFAGKGYKYGYSGHSGSHVGYKGENYSEVCREAKRLLNGAILSEMDWRDLLDNLNLNKNDFVYLDPPYYNTSNLPYQNIDHEELVKYLKKSNFRWVLSGYKNELYLNYLGEPKHTRLRNSEVKSYNKRKKINVLECVWTDEN